MTTSWSPGPALGVGLSVNVPAVIVGADVAALGIARSLGAAGVRVIMVDNDTTLPAMHSRYVERFRASAMSGPALIDGLLALRARLPHRPLLFLRTDVQVRAVSRYRERLQEAFQIRLPEHGCLCELLHKEGFQSVAQRHGFSVPRAVIVREERDFPNFAEIDFPAVVKPCDTEFLVRTQAPRAQLVRSREEAAAVCRTALSRAPE